MFQQHLRCLYTWVEAGNTVLNQIEYIMVKQCWKSSDKTAKTLPGADVWRDHQLLADIWHKLKEIVTGGKVLRFDLLNNRYKIETSNKFDLSQSWICCRSMFSSSNLSTLPSVTIFFNLISDSMLFLSLNLHYWDDVIVELCDSVVFFFWIGVTESLLSLKLVIPL